MLRQSPNQWLNKSLSGSFSGAHNFDVTETNAAQVIIPGHADVMAKGSNPIIFDSILLCESTTACRSIQICESTTACRSIQICESTTACLNASYYSIEGCTVTTCRSINACDSVQICLNKIDMK